MGRDRSHKRKVYKQVKDITKAYLGWAKAGFKVRTPERIAEIYDNICSNCEFFQQTKCLKCGCPIKREGIRGNKLAMANTKCPLEEPKWTEEIDDKNIIEIEGKVRVKNETKKPNIPQNQGGCGCKG